MQQQKLPQKKFTYICQEKKGNPHFYHQESLPSAKPSAVSNTRKKVKNICVETKTNERKAITSTTNRPNNRLTPLSVSQTHLSFLLHTYLHLVPTLTHTHTFTVRRHHSQKIYIKQKIWVSMLLTSNMMECGKQKKKMEDEKNK